MSFKGFSSTVARFQKRLSANFRKKFGQMGKNSAFFQTYIFTAKNVQINISMAYLDN
jgi:hypothetical protein